MSSCAKQITGELTLNNTGKGHFLYWDGNELVESCYLFHLGESLSIQLGNHSQPCWRPTPWPLASCSRWWPTFQVSQCHRSVRDAGHWCGRRICQRNHTCTDDHFRGLELETGGRPPSPGGPKDSWFRGVKNELLISVNYTQSMMWIIKEIGIIIVSELVRGHNWILKTFLIHWSCFLRCLLTHFSFELGKWAIIWLVDVRCAVGFLN